jgi:Metallopeptidase family M24
MSISQSLRSGVFGQISKIKQIPLISMISPTSTHEMTRAEMAGFRRAQGIAFDCAVGVAKELKLGWTEREAAEWMEAFLASHGVRSYFHNPLCWFGERTRFKNFTSSKDALPSDRALCEGDVICVDLAPIVGGYVGDIGFSFTLKPHDGMTKVRSYLLELRRQLPEWFQSSMTTAEIWKRVDQDIKSHGFENCHVKYSFHVLGHRVHKVPASFFPSAVGVYSLHAYWALMSRGLFPELLSPWHKGEKIGLWAIEPHIGYTNDGHDFGAKFEEILVVEKDRVYWLEDSPPHVTLPAGIY